MVKNPPASAGDAGDVGSIPGLGRSPGEGDGNLLQYSCLENSMDRRALWATVHGVTKESDMIERMGLYRRPVPLQTQWTEACVSHWVTSSTVRPPCSPWQCWTQLSDTHTETHPHTDTHTSTESVTLSDISSSAFSFCLQYSPASGAFPMNRLFSIGD